MVRNVIKILILVLGIALPGSAAKLYSNLASGDFLSFLEIKSLLTKIKPKPSEVDRLGSMMNTVFSSSQQDLKRLPLQFDKARYKNYLRVSHWNLESVDLDNLQKQLSSFSREDQEILSSTDIFTLNNVGFYNEAAKFQNMAEIFADAFSASYVFAPEFLEASPELLKQTKLFEDFRALRGNAIISRYPILMAKVLRLPACYDWFYPEEQKILYDPDKELKAKNRAGEGKLDLVRRGGRNALVADILLPNDHVITVVNSQLENRAEAKCRQRQLKAALHYIKTFTNPLVFAVDMNNIGKSAAPQTITGAIEKSVKDPKFYAKQVIGKLNPFSLVTTLTSLTYGRFRKQSDPTVKDIPFLLPNQSERLFKTMEEFNFDDGRAFDFSGGKELANSNDRKGRAYLKTYQYKTWLGTAKRKLDWIFVKAISDHKDIYYYPVEPITLSSLSLNENLDTLSMHYPISLKLMI